MYGNAVCKARWIFQKVSAVLYEKFGIKGIGTVEEDVDAMMAGV
jgi:hydroxylamine reductase (hybrid-cluster protein)